MQAGNLCTLRTVFCLLCEVEYLHMGFPVALTKIASTTVNQEVYEGYCSIMRILTKATFILHTCCERFTRAFLMIVLNREQL